MRNILMIGSILTALVGCTVSPVERDRYYRLAPLEPVGSSLGENVELRRIQTPGLLGGRSLLVVETTDPVIAREVRGSLWVSPPSHWLTEMILKRGMSAVRLVNEGAPSMPRSRLTLTLDDLFINTKQQTTSVGLSGVFLFDEVTHRVSCLQSSPFETAGSVESASMDGFRDALSGCLTEIDGQIAEIVR